LHHVLVRQRDGRNRVRSRARGPLTGPGESPRRLLHSTATEAKTLAPRSGGSDLPFNADPEACPACVGATADAIRAGEPPS
jgi:hypothetical protein